MAGLVGNGCVDHSNSLVEKDETTVSKYEILLDVFEKLSSVIDQVFNQFEKDLEGVKEEHKAIRVELDTLIAESQGDVIGPLAQLTLAINKLVVDKVLKGRMDPENFYCIDKKISRMEKAFNGHYRYVRSFKSEEDREKAKEEWRALKTEIGLNTFCCLRHNLMLEVIFISVCRL